MSFWDSLRSGVNSLPIAGGLTASLWGDPKEEAHQRQLEESKQQLAEYRPEVMEARMNAFKNSSLAFNPMQNLIGQMYGQQAVPDIASMVQNPFSESARDGIYKDAFGTSKAPPPNAPHGVATGQLPQHSGPSVDFNNTPAQQPQSAWKDLLKQAEEAKRLRSA